MATVEQIFEDYDAEIAQNVEKRQFESLDYYRYVKDKSGLNRGRLFLLDSSGTSVQREIPAFPHINRVYHLENGVQQFFGDSTFHVEEKLDGYNTRIFQHGGEIYATTKGGFICPFTTEWARLWGEIANLYKFYTDHPEWLICAEVAGHNPYNSQRDPDMPDGARLFIFDLMDDDGNYLDPEERYRVMERYDLPGVPTYGEYSMESLDDLMVLLQNMNQKEREGVVMKSSHKDQYLKFVTPRSDIKDIHDNIILHFDTHPFYFRNRLMRAILFLQEFELDKNEYAERIGRAFIDGLDELEDFDKVEEDYTIFVQNTNTWRKTRQLIRGEVDIETKNLEYASLHDREMIQVDFSRVFQKSTNRYQSILQGFPHTD
jgi:putative ATP-dependent DNA ligase